jgi:sucrose-6-phosphate hydrolase SacC (GH32 family)
MTIGEANLELALVQGDMLEIRVEFEEEESFGQRLGVWVRQSPTRDEETLIYYDRGCAELGVDREKTTLSAEERTRGVQSGRLDLAGESLRLHIYMDRSMIEVYANGLKSLTTRVYPSRTDSLGLQLQGSGNARIRSLDIWAMKSIYL